MYATKDKETGSDATVPVLKHYTAFNVEQIDGIDLPDAPIDDPNSLPFEPLAEAERIVGGYVNKPAIEYLGTRACYKPIPDVVQMPAPERFDCREAYYSTLFHELSHSTGHGSRLDRGLDTEPVPFGSPDYSREELVAEMSAAFLCAASGISPPTIEQSAAYLQSWISVLKGDKRLVIGASGAAQKSTDLILGAQFHDASSEMASSKSTTKAATTTKPEEGADNSHPMSSQLDLF